MRRTQGPGTLSPFLHLPHHIHASSQGVLTWHWARGYSGRPGTSVSPPSLWLLRKTWPKPSPLWASVSSFHGQCSRLYTGEVCLCRGCHGPSEGRSPSASFSLGRRFSLQTGPRAGVWLKIEPDSPSTSMWPPAVSRRPNNSSACQLALGVSAQPVPQLGLQGGLGLLEQDVEGSPLHTAEKQPVAGAGSPNSTVNLLCGLKQVFSLFGSHFPSQGRGLGSSVKAPACWPQVGNRPQASP